MLGVKKSLLTALKMECGVYDLAVSDSGIKATVESVLDYGAEKFLKCAIGENTVYVKCDGERSGEIYLAPDFDRVGIVETERAIKII